MKPDLKCENNDCEVDSNGRCIFCKHYPALEYDGRESQKPHDALVKPIYASTQRLHKNRLVVKCCPYCKETHYHGDGTTDGTGEITGNRVADCGNGHYELIEINKSV